MDVYLVAPNFAGTLPIANYNSLPSKFSILISVLSEMEHLQPHTALLLFLFLGSLLFIFRKKEKKVENAEKKQKPVRKESADDENDDDDDDEEDYEKPALDEHLEHVPFQHEVLSEGEMISKSAQFYSTMNKRRTLR